MNKKLAIFIPCYNAAATIGETLRSIRESIRYHGEEVPVYIYDDCSKDDSLDVARNAWGQGGLLNIRRNEKNSGERITTNQAFGYFSGKYDWAFIIHADDIVKPEWIAELAAHIEKVDDEGCFTVWSSFDGLDNETGKISPGDNTGKINALERTTAEKIHFLTRLYGCWHISGAAVNVHLSGQLKGFDENMPQFGDTDFYVRGLLAGYRDIYLSRTLTFYRVIRNSVSSVSVRTNRDIREGLYLIGRFDSRLDGREMRTICSNLLKLSSRRLTRWLLKGNIYNALFCCRTNLQLLRKYIQSYGRKIRS